MIKDFSRCHLSGCYYAGSSRKTGILLNGEKYILKYRRPSPAGLSYHHVSEYLGSQIYDMLGIVTQDTWLGTYQGEEVVVMRDFITEKENFVPFCNLMDGLLDLENESVRYEYRNLAVILDRLLEPERREEAVRVFWDMFLVDAFLGNFKRWISNWGFLKTGNRYRVAPVFGNSTCLFPEIVSDQQCLEFLCSKEKMERKICRPPVLRIVFDGRRCSYFDVVESRLFPECSKALWRIIKKIDFVILHALVNCVEFMSDIRKTFLLAALEERYKKFLLEPFERMM